MEDERRPLDASTPGRKDAPGAVTKRVVWALIGAGIGYALALYVFTDDAGRLGHRLFWEAVGDGRGGYIEWWLKRSETFKKVALGALVGGLLGLGLARRPPSDTAAR